ncbi:RagB/SusD family nutrient uptake outer membrane protein [Spirosoma montaniterrae]|uniref:Carbohydrate-binding protein SusD n=1 Tax=Spirosoma montaniterrae TaxID=1178516 RepID=A0A1P9WT22_9BACT|nr:RagB/SusD family nutrient uptake outer membrane protein [Spirosoma montaniterrae]AQG78512.1 carbohydrate-binding protein SusD [Spirosoma montaniterrae]
MNAYIKRFSAVAVATVALTLGSCSSLLEVKPQLQVDAQTALSTPDGLDGALNGVYDRLQSLRVYGRDLIAIPEALADNGRATNKSGRLNAEYRNNLQSHFANWTTAYFAINQANLVLENIPRVFTGTDQTTVTRRNGIEGQAQFLRALLYFDLMRAYAYEPGVEVAAQNRGGVPLLLTGVLDQSQVTLPARASIEEVYTQIYKDLNEASTKLTNTQAPAYATQASALALLSRVALYRKDYATAVKAATDALATNVGRFLDQSSYIGGWRSARHPESIFELVYTIPENTGVNESLQTTYTTLVELGNRARTGGFGDLVPTASLLADLESERASATAPVPDIRRQLYELGTTGRGTAEIECTKFLGKNGTVNLDNIPLIRVSELYLNRAEANAMLGNDAAALTDVNAIRTRSGLTARTVLTGAPLLTEILKQRRIEFAFEGHRWFDLKRRGQDIVKTGAGVTTVPYTDIRILANIPVNELQTNRNIRQNAGY